MAADETWTAPPPAPAWSRDRLEGYFRLGVFVTLLLIGFVATVRGYMALEQAILTWLRPQWVPVAQAVFSLLVVGLVVWLMRVWVIARAR